MFDKTDTWSTFSPKISPTSSLGDFDSSSTVSWAALGDFSLHTSWAILGDFSLHTSWAILGDFSALLDSALSSASIASFEMTAEAIKDWVLVG